MHRPTNAQEQISIMTLEAFFVCLSLTALTMLAGKLLKDLSDDL